MSSTRRSNRAYVNELAEAKFFAGCSRHELRAIASFCTPLVVKAGRVLTRQGDPGLECFIVLEGQAVVERNGSIIGHVVDGSIIGEIALVHRTPRTATVTVATDMKVLVMSTSEFAAMQALGIGNAAWERMHELVAERMEVVERTPAAPTPTPSFPSLAR
jgi:CRP-like cAMP-binding protein